MINGKKTNTTDRIMFAHCGQCRMQHRGGFPTAVLQDREGTLAMFTAALPDTFPSSGKSFRDTTDFISQALGCTYQTLGYIYQALEHTSQSLGYKICRMKRTSLSREKGMFHGKRNNHPQQEQGIPPPISSLENVIPHPVQSAKHRHSHSV